jgi:hypothetical protein
MNLATTTNHCLQQEAAKDHDGLAASCTNGPQSAPLERSQMPGAEEPESGFQLQFVDPGSRIPQVDLDLHATFFPLGFPVELHSNSPAVMRAAQESWKDFQRRSVSPPLELRITVRDSVDCDSSLPPAPACYIDGNTMLSIANPHNFACCDLLNGRAFGSITSAIANSSLYLRYHFLEAAVLVMVAALRAAPVHAACVSTHGSGMLLCGYSGVGKSSLSYAAARAGWTFVCDDASYLVLDESSERQVVGNCYKIRFRHAAVHLFPELDGRQITPRLASKPSVEVTTAEFPGITTAESATVDYIVFLNRRSPDPDALVPLAKDSVLPWFKQTIVSAEHARPAQEAAIERLLSAPVFELRYRDLDWAIKRLESLAATGR